MTTRRKIHLDVSDYRSWLLCDSIVAWSLDIVKPSRRRQMCEALVELAGRLDSRNPTADLDPEMSIGVDSRLKKFFLISSGRQLVCHFSFRTYANDESLPSPSALVAKLPRMLYQSSLRHPRLIYQDRRLKELSGGKVIAFRSPVAFNP
ncbi:hypothetical protein H6F89_00030 [Cyanobacteria bacterium FACHB-63]|nr:hypothetical protein [Cyanobacteria bacterium FACHB-63]